MKALQKLKPEPGIWMVDAEKPSIGPNDVLIKIKKTGICGTDLHIYHWDAWSQKTVSTPMTIGHEFVGVVADMGKEVSGFKIGDRVSGEAHLVCGHCRNCRAGKRHLCPNTIGMGYDAPGCFAEYFVMPASNVFPLPEAISDEVAAILDPLGNAVHTALSFDLVGEDVLITGAGPIGVMAVAIAQHVGARHIVVTEINEYRQQLAKKMGATLVVNPREVSLTEVMKKLNMKEGFDVGLEMSGSSEALNQMLSVMVNGGRVALLGLLPSKTAIDWPLVIFKGLLLKGIYGREMFETWYKMTTMLQSGLDISPVITHQFSVSEYQKAFDLFDTGRSGKVILNWES